MSSAPDLLGAWLDLGGTEAALRLVRSDVGEPDSTLEGAAPALEGAEFALWGELPALREI